MPGVALPWRSWGLEWGRCLPGLGFAVARKLHIWEEKGPSPGLPRLHGSWWGRGQHTWKDPEDGGGRFPEGRVRMMYLLCELTAHTLLQFCGIPKMYFFPDLTKK